MNAESGKWEFEFVMGCEQHSRRRNNTMAVLVWESMKVLRG